MESSGTTTLAKTLAAHYKTVWVPEFGRACWEGRQYLSDQQSWAEWEFVNIARMQQEWEDRLALSANRLLICDTDALATQVWHWRYRKHYSKAVERIAASRSYHLYILTAPDFMFQQDGTRELEHKLEFRMRMHEEFRRTLQANGVRWIEVNGTEDNRKISAISAIDKILTFDPLPYTWSDEVLAQQRSAEKDTFPKKLAPEDGVDFETS